MSAEETRFGREIKLFGAEGLRKLSSAKVAVIGLGGVGSYVVEGLARAGIGWLVLADCDQINISNTNRQIHALEGNYGRFKADVLKERVQAINPDAAVVTFNEFVDSNNFDVILHGDISYVIDAIDSVTAKVNLLEYCHRHEIPVISSMGTGNKLDPFALKIADISKTHTCPLAKVVRKLLRDRGISTGIKTLFSEELPLNPIAEESEIAEENTETAPKHQCQSGCQNLCKSECNSECSQNKTCPMGNGQPMGCGKCCSAKQPIKRQTPGSTSYLPPIAGLMLASEVIRSIVGSD